MRAVFKNILGKGQSESAPTAATDVAPGQPLADSEQAPLVQPTPNEAAADMNNEMTVADDAGGHAPQQLDEQTRRALASKFRAAAFGEVTSILMRSVNHRGLRLADLEWLVVPAVLTRQFSIAKAKPQNDANAAGVPVGVAFWARVSDEVDQQLATDGNVRLKPADWASGENYWLLEIVAPQKVANAMLEELKRTAFAGKSFKVRRIVDGNLTVDVLQGAAAAA